MAVLIENGSDLFEIRNRPSQLFLNSYAKKDSDLFATTVLISGVKNKKHSFGVVK